MTAEPTYEELQQQVKKLQADLAECGRAKGETFDTKGRTCLLHPDWPEAKWNISGVFAHRRLVHFLIHMMKSLKISHVLDSFHGSPDLCWNGGRMNAKIPFYPDSEKYLRWINDQGIGVFLTFSNLVLEEEHLSDSDSNRLLDGLDEKCGLNGVIVSSDLLSDYIRQKKPGLKQIASVVKSFVENPEGKIEWYREIQKRFDRVVVHTDHIFDLDLLDKLDRGKAEILITEECSYKCPNRGRHQKLVSIYNLERSEEVLEKIKEIKKSCRGGSQVLSEERNPGRSRTCFLMNDEVKTIYEMGFRNFKISGRRKPLYGLAWNVINFVYNPALAHAFARVIHTRIDHEIKTYFTKMARGQPAR